MAIALGLAFLAVVNLGVRYVELVTGRYVTGGVPPVAAFGALLALLGLRALLRRFFRVDLDREQVLIVYSMVALGTFIAGAYAIRAFLPHLVSLQYWSATKPALTPYLEYLPAWLFPSDKEALRQYFEGNYGRGVPWGLWVRPLAIWLTFWVAMFGAGWSLLLLFRKQWLQSERLSFPLLTLPLALATGGDNARFGSRPLMKNPVLWFGIGAAALFDAVNICHALWPVVPAPGFYIPLSGLFTERTLAPFNAIYLFFMLEAVGFGYFVPLDISFSLWFFFLLEKVFASTLLASGVETPGLPFMQEQSAGAYLMVGVLLLAGSRTHLVRLFRGAFLGSGRGRTAEDREARVAWIGLALCAAYLLWFMTQAGLAVRVALPFLAILACFMLVYARLRAETGVPVEFMYPYALPKEVLVQTFSVHGVLQAGGPRAMVMLSSFAWLSRHHPGHMTAADQIDALKLGDVARIARRRLFIALAIAFVVGCGLACWSHLAIYYDLGSNLAGGAGQSEYRAKVAMQEFERMAKQIESPPNPDYVRLGYVAGGAGFALLLALLRNVWLGSPFHPLGFILATAYGDSSSFFFPLFVAWALKTLILRAGGLRLYRDALPFFIGLIVGRFTVGGILWPLLSLIISPEASAGYHIYFG